MPNGRAVTATSVTSAPGAPGGPDGPDGPGGPETVVPAGAPRWVDEIGLTGSAGLLARLVRLNMLVSAALDGLVEPFGLTVADYLVLGTIRHSPGGRGA